MKPGGFKLWVDCVQLVQPPPKMRPERLRCCGCATKMFSVRVASVVMSPEGACGERPWL